MNQDIFSQLLFLIKLSIAIQVAQFAYQVIMDLWGLKK